MLVQALAGYADTHLRAQLDDVAFEQRPVPYLLQIGKEGRFEEVIPRFTEVAVGRASRRAAKADATPKTRRQPQLLSAPRSPANRNSGLHPLLGADDIKYVLGPGAWTKPSETSNHQERHDAFVAQLRRVAQETGDRALVACALFYDQPAEVERAREALAEAAPGANVALYVFGQPVTDREEVRAWWRQHYEAGTAERSSEVAECLISGIVGPIPPTHPKIKGTAALGGQPAGVSLMSFDKPAFRSYGWEQNANSPVSADRAMAYVLALNDLLKPGSRNRKDFEGVAFLFWLKRDAAGFEFESLLEDPPGDELLDRARAIVNVERRAYLGHAERNELFMAAVSATGSRLVVRSWSALPLEEAVENVVGFWSGLKMQPFDAAQPPRAEPFWKLLYALDREGKPPASRVVALRQRALEGPRKPLGYRIVADVLARLRVDPAKRIDLAAHGLLRLCLNDLHAIPGDGETMPAALDPAQPNIHPAYVCGRLLALHDTLQFLTFKIVDDAEVNSTVADRYYTLMMNSPATGLGKVLDLGRKHLSKLRRSKKPQANSTGEWITRRICELEEQLGGEPPKLFDLHDKARFALGFYHEKALRFHPRKGAQEAGDDSPEVTSDSNPEETQ